MPPRGMLLSIIISAVNQAKPGIAAAQKGLRTLKDVGVKAAHVLKTAFKAAAGAIKALASAGLYVAKILVLPLTAVAGAIGLATKKAADFQYSMKKVNIALGDSALNMEEIQAQLKQMAMRMGISLTELTEGLYQVIVSGVPATEAMRYLQTAADLAVGGFTDLTTAIGLLDAVMDSFGISADKARNVADKLNVAAKESEKPFSVFTESLLRLAPQVETIGIGFDDFISVMALAGKSIANPRKMLAGLSDILNFLITPTEESQAALEKLRVQFDIQTIQSKGFAVALRDVFNAAGGNVEVLKKLGFSIDAITIANKVATVSGKELTDFMGKLESASGETADRVAQVSDTLTFKWNQFTATVGVATNEIGELFLPAATKMFEKLREVAAIIPKIDFKQIWQGFKEGGERATEISSAFIEIGKTIFELFKNTLTNVLAMVQAVAGVFFSPFVVMAQIAFEKVAAIIRLDILNAIDAVIEKLRGLAEMFPILKLGFIAATPYIKDLKDTIGGAEQNLKDLEKGGKRYNEILAVQAEFAKTQASIIEGTILLQWKEVEETIDSINKKLGEAGLFKPAMGTTLFPQAGVTAATPPFGIAGAAGAALPPRPLSRVEQATQGRWGVPRLGSTEEMLKRRAEMMKSIFQSEEVSETATEEMKSSIENMEVNIDSSAINKILNEKLVNAVKGMKIVPQTGIGANKAAKATGQTGPGVN